MAYPLIILGAGASFDYIEQNKYPERFHDLFNKFKPPLSNNIFDAVKFIDFIDRYSPYTTEIGSYINNRIAGGKITLEQCLTDIRYNKISKNPEISKQIVSLLFYLADLFSAVSREYFVSHNNYTDLLFRIKANGGKACFVNFNYDLLLEKNLKFGLEPTDTINDYVSGQIKVIKIHGACNWFYGRPVIGHSKRASYNYALSDAQVILDRSNQEYNIVINNPTNCRDLSYEGTEPEIKVFHPAIAIPIQSKVYVCPESHIQILKDKLKQVDRVIIIGWKAADPFLVELLKEELSNRQIPIALVTGTKSKDGVLSNLGESLAKNVKLINQTGFTDFMQSEESEGFLNQEV